MATKKEGFIAGFVILFIGLLIEWHAYLFTFPALKDKEVFTSSARLIMADLLQFKVDAFLGGGMFGALIYKPVSFLFSNLGAFLIGGLVILLGLFLMTPWDVYDVSNFFKNVIYKLHLKHQEKKSNVLSSEKKRRLWQSKNDLKTSDWSKKKEEKKLSQLLRERLFQSIQKQVRFLMSKLLLTQ